MMGDTSFASRPSQNLTL